MLRFRDDLELHNTFCGIRTTEAITVGSWREAHDQCVAMGTENPDENVCAECRAQLVTARLSVQQD